jgi:ParB family chromosome partitioning protein
MREKLEENVKNVTLNTETTPTDDDDLLQVFNTVDILDKDTGTTSPKIKMIKLDDLVPFKNHPFKLYEGQQLIDMTESIRANGIYSPIIARSYTEKKGKYEILSGHNRTTAARSAGLKEVPVIIKDGLTDEEALLIVTESNLIQRSFADLKHSERAIVLAMHYEAMKKQSGYRSDLLNEINELTCAPMGHGMRTRDKLSAQYGLGKTTIARYLRVDKLIPALKDRLDNDEIGMRAAEALSYLNVKEQEIVEGSLKGLLAKGKKISIKQADTLKEKSAKKELDETSINEIFNLGYFAEKVKPVKLSGQFLSQHFKSEQSAEDIEKIIAEALKLYFKDKI